MCLKIFLNPDKNICNNDHASLCANPFPRSLIFHFFSNNARPEHSN